jgi:hypothetical protein
MVEEDAEVNAALQEISGAMGREGDGTERERAMGRSDRAMV